MPTMVYLGDGVYAHFDGADIVLTITDDTGKAQEIILEPLVWDNLMRMVRFEQEKRDATSQKKDR